MVIWWIWLCIIVGIIGVVALFIAALFWAKIGNEIDRAGAEFRARLPRMGYELAKSIAEEELRARGKR